ncbi:hypothetical protein O181_113388 [Austropuccinia psidii MF-1]|uniref:Transcription initiation factor TFIID subunit 10 n=1 Tax=Austropuccinia psidii MF-1 TaxID=1389203 RepID=A0A9Q3K2X9_9BASI|nr:hypothetical protein [Austropuccinia psidii MF-1]
MSGFNSGAIDPALLSGSGSGNAVGSLAAQVAGAISPAQLINHRPGAHLSSSSAQSSASVLPSQSSTGSSNPFAGSQSYASTLTAAGSVNNPLSNSAAIGRQASLPPAPLASAATLVNGSNQLATMPHDSLANGMSVKEHEMHQKDQELAQLLLKMDEYKPVIPDEVAAYYLQKVGFECNDIRVQRVLVLACQKFISDIAQDAFSYARTRTGQVPGGRQGPLVSNVNSGALANVLPPGTSARRDRTRTVLTQEDLAQALAEYGINASRAPYYL